jgi:hypothetical protein
VKILTVETTAGFSPGDIVTFTAGRWAWYVRLAAFLRRVELPPRKTMYRIVAVTDDHTVAVEEFP